MTIDPKTELYIEKKSIDLLESNRKMQRENIDKIEKHLGKQDLKIDRIIDKVDEKYARKWVEKALLGVVVFVFSGLGTAAINLLLK